MMTAALYLAGALISFLTAGKLAWNLLSPICLNIWGKFHEVISGIKRIKTVMDTVDSMSKFIGPNGGSSLMDKVNKLTLSTEGISQQVERVHEDLSSQIADLHIRTRMRLDLGKEIWWEADKNGSFVWLSKSYLELVHGQRNELLGNGWVSSVHEDDRSDAFAEWRKCVNDSRDFRARFRIVSENGDSISTSTSAAPIRDANGSITGWLGAVEVVASREERYA